MSSSAFRALIPIALLTLAASGCSSPTEPSFESGCLPAVRVGDTLYQLDLDERVSADALPSGIFAVVQRLNAVCPDTPGAPGEGLVADGDSNFFPVGTRLHSIPDAPASKHVAVEWLGEWLVLEADGAP